MAAALAACSSKNDDGFLKTMKAQGTHYSALADKWEKGDELLLDGNGLIKQGRKEVSKGNSLVEDGENHQAKGNEMIRQGERMKYEVEAEYRQLNNAGL